MVVSSLLTLTETGSKAAVYNLEAFRTVLDAFVVSTARHISLVTVHYRCFTALLSITTFSTEAIHFFLGHLSCINQRRTFITSTPQTLKQDQIKNSVA